MLIWMRRYVVWLCVALALFGAGMAIWGWRTTVHLEKVMRDGKPAEALIEDASAVTRKSALTYSVNLAWRGDDGKVQRASDVPVTRAFANEIIADGVLVVPSTKIRYLSDAAQHAAVIVVDHPRRLGDAVGFIWWGIAGLCAGLFGAIGLPALFRRASFARTP